MIPRSSAAPRPANHGQSPVQRSVVVMCSCFIARPPLRASAAPPSSSRRWSRGRGRTFAAGTAPGKSARAERAAPISTAPDRSAGGARSRGTLRMNARRRQNAPLQIPRSPCRRAARDRIRAGRIHDVVDWLPARRLQRVEAGLVKRRGLDDSALILFHDRHLGGRAVRRGEQRLFPAAVTGRNETIERPTSRLRGGFTVEARCTQRRCTSGR